MNPKKNSKPEVSVEEIFKTNFSNKIRELRGSDSSNLGLSFRTGLTGTTLSKAENKIGFVTYETMIRFLRGAELSICEIIPDDTWDIEKLPEIEFFRPREIAELLRVSPLPAAIQAFKAHDYLFKPYLPDNHFSRYNNKPSSEIPLFGEKIRALREFREITVSDFSEMVGVKSHSYMQFEMGMRNPRMDFVLKIARNLKCRLDYIVSPKEKIPDEMIPYMYFTKIRYIASSIDSLYAFRDDMIDAYKLSPNSHN